MKHKSRLFILTLVVVFSLSLVLSSSLSFASNNSVPKVKVIIEFDYQPGPMEELLVGFHGGEINYTYNIIPAIAATLPQKAVEALSHNPNILGIYEDIPIQADSTSEYPWGVSHIGSDIVHTAGNKGENVKVAIIDSGIANHPDLNVVGGKSFVSYTNSYLDDDGHGTHVAGTVAASLNGAGVVGVAPNVDLYALKVLDSNGSGNFSSVIAAIEWSATNGIDITNNSYGSSRDPGLLVQQAFDNAYNSGVLHVSSAGNTGRPNGRGNTVGYPARYESVIAVAATDDRDKRASFSSTGDQVELAAPGVNIKSTTMDGDYQDGWDGTSMASPHVAGVAALVLSNNSSLTNEEVRSILNNTADDLGDIGRDTLYGYGLVDADEAANVVVTPINNAPTVSITAPTDGSSYTEGTGVIFTATASDDEDGDLTANINWSSNKDGNIILDENNSIATLSVGTHTITASVSDSGSLSGSDSISVIITSDTSNEDSYIQDVHITYSAEGGRFGDAHLLVTLNIKDNLNNPVEGVNISIDLYRADSFETNGVLFSSFNGTTDLNGSVTFKITNAPAGVYTTDITNLSSTLPWDGTSTTDYPDGYPLRVQ